MRIARIKIQVDSPGRWERAYKGNAILKRCVLSLEHNIGKEDKFRVSGGSEFHSHGPMTEKGQSIVNCNSQVCWRADTVERGRRWRFCGCLGCENDKI